MTDTASAPLDGVVPGRKAGNLLGLRDISATQGAGEGSHGGCGCGGKRHGQGHGHGHGKGQGGCGCGGHGKRHAEDSSHPAQTAPEA